MSPRGGLRVLGIDPGLTRCGYAVVDSARPRPIPAAIGVMATPVDAELPERLARLRVDITSLLEEYAPDVVAVERVFFQVNVRTAMSVGQASGVILASAARRGLDVEIYTPTQIKSAVAGDGAASKAQIQKMVQMRLRLSRPPSPADAADAAAIALCHLASAPLRQRVASATGRRP